MKKFTVEPWKGFHDGVVPTTAQEVIEKITEFRLSKALDDQGLVLNPTDDVKKTIEYIFTLHKDKHRKATNSQGDDIPYVHHALRTSYFVSRVRNNDPSAVIPALLIGAINQSREDNVQRQKLVSFVKTLQVAFKVLPVVEVLLVSNVKMSGGGKFEATKKLWKTNFNAFVVQTVSCLENLDADLVAIAAYGNRGVYFKKRHFKTSFSEIKKFHTSLLYFMESLEPTIKNDTNVAMIVGQYRDVLEQFAPEKEGAKKEVSQSVKEQEVEA